MAIETADDMLLFFDTDDFGDEVAAVVDGSPFPFNAIFTDANEPSNPGGIKASITSATPRLICRRVDSDHLKRDVHLQVKGKSYLVKNIELRGAVSTVFLKEA